MITKLIILYFLACVNGAKVLTKLTRIDRPISIQEYPSFASLEYNNSHWCGGAIITPYHVVTSARCLINVEKELLKVRVATAERELKGGLHRVKELIIHDKVNFLKEVPENDLGIVQVKSPFVFNKTCNKVNILKGVRKFSYYTYFNLVGYGLGGMGLDRKLKVMDLNKEDDIATLLYYEHKGGAKRSQICAGLVNTPGGKASRADLGDPLYFRGQLIGILSYLKTYWNSPKPEVYTNLDYFSEWIDGVIDY